MIIKLKFSETTLFLILGKCFGVPKAFCDIILDKNNTFMERGLKDSLKDIGYDSEYYQNVLDHFRDLIIVHLKFMQPEIDVINPKYTELDTFANVGGIFGIFGEITGVSFLGLLNLCILFVKLIFCHHKSSKNQ